MGGASSSNFADGDDNRQFINNSKTVRGGIKNNICDFAGRLDNANFIFSLDQLLVKSNECRHKLKTILSNETIIETSDTAFKFDKTNGTIEIFGLENVQGIGQLLNKNVLVVPSGGINKLYVHLRPELGRIAKNDVAAMTQISVELRQVCELCKVPTITFDIVTPAGVHHDSLYNFSLIFRTVKLGTNAFNNILKFGHYTASIYDLYRNLNQF